MSHIPSAPNKTGVYYLTDISLREIVPFIDWRFYFLAWRLSGHYEGIDTVHDCPSCQAGWLRGFDEKDRLKAEEALDSAALLEDCVANVKTTWITPDI